MRIGIICEGKEKSRCGFKTAKFGEFRTAEVYMTTVSGSRTGRRFLRRLRSCAKELQSFGIGICAAEEGFKAIERFGIMPITGERRMLQSKAADMAFAFSAAHNIEADTAIIGGSFSDVTDAAVQILERCRNVYIKNPAYEDIAEALADMTGASVREDAPQQCLEIHMCDEKNFLQYGDLHASFSDFEIKLPGEIFEDVPGHLCAALGEILEMSGVLRKSEIKVEYILN